MVYGRLTVLEDVSFSIRPGEILGLIGPNGAGKTTLLECVAGLLPARSGTLSEGGRALDAAARRQRIFYLPDAIAPWPAQPVGWTLDYAVGFFGGDAGRRPEVVRALGLEPLLSVRIGQLSKGERKRALLAVALLTPHPILLIDEPLDGLDLRQGREVAAVLRAHAAGGRTLVLSIHQIAEAARLCDRFVLLSGGRVRAEGTMDDIKAMATSRPAPRDLEEAFLALA